MATALLSVEEDQARLVLDALRRIRSLSGVRLARSAGMSRQSVSDKLMGARRITLADVGRFAKALEVEPAVFFMTPDDAIRWTLDHAPAFAGEGGFAELPFLMAVLGSAVAAWVGVKAPQSAMWIAENQRTDESYDNYHSSQSQNRCFVSQKVTNLTPSAISVYRPHSVRVVRPRCGMYRVWGSKSAALGLGSE